MSDYTPGPWSTNHLTNDIYQQDNGLTVVELIAYGVEARKRFRANKALISAAPEMLDALEDLLPEIECRCDSAYTGRGMHEANSLCHHVELVRSVIAKATGQEESE